MKHLKRFNEAILPYKGENIDGFYSDMKERLRNSRFIQLEEAARIGQQNGIEVVDYATFYRELPENDKETAPPRGVPAFALANPVTRIPRVVIGEMMPPPPRGKQIFGRQGPPMPPPMPNRPMPPIPIDERLLEYIYHMLKHENVHVRQHEKRPGYNKPLPDPKNQKAYFSDTDEIMAYSQSVVDQLMGEFDPNTIEEGVSKLNKVRLYQDIKKEVDEKVFNKYKKYIYLYLEQEIEEKNSIEPVEEPKSSGISAEMAKYQKLFDEAYDKKDKFNTDKYGKILGDLYQKSRGK